MESLEELQVRHRKEQRDLQSRITQKKKQASKKTRKGVNEECDRLEADLRARQAAELAAIDGNHASQQDETQPTVELDKLELASRDEGARIEEGPSVNGDTIRPLNGSNAADTSPQSRKPNRQKARLARRAAEQEQQALQAAAEAHDLPDLKTQEHERMREAMKERGLVEKEIRADGHCLYSAVADQLEQLHVPLGATPDVDGKPVVAYRVVRAAAAEYIENHQEDFVPFLEEPLEEYVTKIRETGEWGGQLELMALAKTYKMDINVLQDFGRVEKIEGGDGEGEGRRERKSIWLGYYKHGFGLGEHYNSLRKAAG